MILKKIITEIIENLSDFDSYQIAWIQRKKNQILIYLNPLILLCDF